MLSTGYIGTFAITYALDSIIHPLYNWALVVCRVCFAFTYLTDTNLFFANYNCFDLMTLHQGGVQVIKGFPFQASSWRQP